MEIKRARYSVLGILFVVCFLFLFPSFLPAPIVSVNGLTLLTESGGNLILSSGQFLGPAGTKLLPTYSASSDPDTGIEFPGGVLMITVDGTRRLQVAAGQIQISNTMAFGWSSVGVSGLSDVLLFRDAPHILNIRDGANANTLRISGTDDGAGNFQRLEMTADGANTVTILATAGGTHSANQSISLEPSGTGTLKTTANTIQVQGASGSIQIANPGQFFWQSRAALFSPADGVLRLTNSANTDFTRLQFGNTTSSFPAIAKNGTALSIVLADGTNGANLGIGVSTFGTSGTEVLGINADGVVPTTSPAGIIQIFADDSSLGAANATLAIRTEQAVEAIGTFTPSHKLRVWINGVEYWLQLDAV